MYMLRPLPIGSSANAVPPANAVIAAPARRIVVKRIFVSPFPHTGPVPVDGLRFLLRRTGSAELLNAAQPGKECRAPLRLIDVKIKDDRDEEDETPHRVDPSAGETRGYEARLDDGDDEAAEERA